jgi:hypothetical protein
MRIVPLVLLIVLFSEAAFASEIREFDLKTIERLGNELIQVSQQPDRGATNAIRKRAKQTAMEALRGRLFNIRYDYVVLDDPDGSGFLVYALGQGRKAGEVVVHGHFRVGISADGQKTERVDALSRSLTIKDTTKESTPGYHDVAFVTALLISARPVETLIYASNLMKMPIMVATSATAPLWIVYNGKITKDKK